MSEPVIITNPEILGGEPVFRGTRVPAKALLDYLMTGETVDTFLDQFPIVTREQVTAFLEYAVTLAVHEQAIDGMTADASAPDIADALSDFIVSQPTLEQIAEFKAAHDQQERMSELLDKNRRGRISDAEWAELEKVMTVSHVITLAKAKARLKMRD
jgi:uncharacterized protein (DUF433 family)